MIKINDYLENISYHNLWQLKKVPTFAYINLNNI